MSVDHARVADIVAARVERIGIPAHIEVQLASLSPGALQERCRTALAEIKAIQTPSISLAADVAAALLGACWTLATTSELRAKVRAAVVEIAHATRPGGPQEEIAIDRGRTIALVQEALGE